MGERVKALAKKLPDFADRNAKERVSMGGLTQVAYVAACLDGGMPGRCGRMWEILDATEGIVYEDDAVQKKYERKAL